MPLPLLGLAALAVQAAPTIAGWFGGSAAEETVKRVSDVAGAIFGTTNPDEIEAAIATDPAKALEWKITVAKIADEQAARQHAERLAEMKAEGDRFTQAVADTQSARSQTVALAQASSPLAWGAAIVSFIVVSGFCLVGYMVFNSKIPAENREMALYLVGQLSGFVSTAVAYWLGSSAGSARKDSELRSARSA